MFAGLCGRDFLDTRLNAIWRTGDKPMLRYVAFAAALLVTACEQPADVASRNLSVAADNFQIARRVIFYNGITNDYMLSIEGLCSLGNRDKEREITVTCKTGPSEFKKHFLGLSDNVTFFAEQLSGASVSTYHYKVVFRPQTIIQDVRLDVSN